MNFWVRRWPRSAWWAANTAAHLAYARGADGISAFNFVYYREHGGAERGPFQEPPFEVFKRLRDRNWLARQPQHYFLSTGFTCPYIKTKVLPKRLKAGQVAEFALDLAPPAGGWKLGGRLRIQSLAAFDQSRFSAKLNGAELAASADVAEHGPIFNPCLLGTPEQLRAWTVPTSALRDGVNKLEIKLLTGAAEIAFLDLVLA